MDDNNNRKEKMETNKTLNNNNKKDKKVGSGSLSLRLIPPFSPAGLSTRPYVKRQPWASNRALTGIAKRARGHPSRKRRTIITITKNNNKKRKLMSDHFPPMASSFLCRFDSTDLRFIRSIIGFIRFLLIRRFSPDVPLFGDFFGLFFKECSFLGIRKIPFTQMPSNWWNFWCQEH